ncbi:hypothetical protein TanjilG_15450 [Lupinus angustifolius]|uniref:Pentacotripeptide-repeat region of PRORP domain-containing protein n=1 Tax=Lupinus angustifolius TaxID=3871 RepID=A0A4P1RL46_LUPAN|nr:PREDICTED: pentatricopeptide repeat-containing protein At1g02370, mitochondrial-like [Lupinus angustifolius]OIW13001.1 hypothetical protein TanjilG_15450 [Lupinus angustifolius]
MNYNGGKWLIRRLSTEAKKISLYRKLSALEMTGGTVSQTLNQYVLEGTAIQKDELERCVRQLRKYHKFQHALEIMEWMELRKVNFASDNYAVYLDLVSKTKGLDAAENYFNNLPPEEKNKYTYGALLNCYCKNLVTDKALAHFEKMDELGFVTNLAFNNLMSLYMRLGQPEKVPLLVDDLKQRKIPMAAFTYHIWMNSYASLNDLDGVERVYEEMKRENGEEISWQTYNNLSAIYVKTKDFEKAELMLKKVEEEVKPQQRETYHFLLSQYAATSNLAEVHRVWDSLKSILPVTNMSYLAMLHSLRRLDDIEGITKCFKEWESKCVTYDIRLVSVVIGAYLRHNLHDEAELVFKEAIRRRNNGPFFKIREMFMLYYLKKSQLVSALSHLEAVFSDVGVEKWRPSPEVASAFLKYYEETDVDGVEELSKILKSHNYDYSWFKSSPVINTTLEEDSQVNHAV